MEFQNTILRIQSVLPVRLIFRIGYRKSPVKSEKLNPSVLSAKQGENHERISKQPWEND